MTVWLLTDEAADRHAATGHPERPERRQAAVDGVREGGGAAVVMPTVEAIDEVTLADVHDPAFVAALDDAEGRGGGWLDADTYLVAGSMQAARLAAGATLQAAIATASGEAQVAFAAVRPPGHHAASAVASGFCLLNSVAVAAAGLRRRGLAHRIAIVDWDVHHGDGTQAIYDADPDLLYLSTHQSPLYPGTGDPADVGTGAGRGTMHNRPLRPGDGDGQFVDAWRSDLLPTMVPFAPEAILVSAGYDAHAADPLANLEVTAAGYEAVAGLVGAAARRLGISGVALTLEGGYDLDALRSSVAATVRGLRAGLGGEVVAT